MSDVSHYTGEAVWMAGADGGHGRYGNYVFSSDASTLLLQPQFKYYFIEMIEYNNQAAARILVTAAEPSAADFKLYNPRKANGGKGMTGLPMEYNPYQPGGAWHYDPATEQHARWRTTTRRSDPPDWAKKAIQRGGELPLVVEFVFADAVPIDSLNQTIDVIDHTGDCRQAKKGKKCVDDDHSSQVAAFERGINKAALAPKMPAFSKYVVDASPRDGLAVTALTAALTALSQAQSYNSAEQAYDTLRPHFKSFNENDVNNLLRHIPNGLNRKAKTGNEQLAYIPSMIADDILAGTFVPKSALGAAVIDALLKHLPGETILPIYFGR